MCTNQLTTYSSILILIAVLFPCSACLGGQLSTTRDGSFQAIAQKPYSISLFWKGEGEPPAPRRDGQKIAKLKWKLDGVTGFWVGSCSPLKADSAFTFTAGEAGAAVTEKTWCELPSYDRFDVLIVGGSASGVAAAVTAARLGLKVGLVEETNRLGGMASNGLGSTDLRQPARSNGFFEDFRRRVMEHYGEGNGLRYEPRVANAIFKDMVYSQPGISLFLRCEAARPIMLGDHVLGAEVRSCQSGSVGKLFAQVTVDATPTGDFAAGCGCEFRAGREPRTADEPHAGVLYYDDAKQAILPGSTGVGDAKQQSYAYLMVWQDNAPNPSRLIEKPRFYDPETYRHSPEWAKTWNATSGKLPNGKYEINQHPFGIDWPDINHDYPTATRERRLEIERMYKDRALGYLYYFQNEKGLSNLGLADDEFVDSENFPQTLYVREARRIMGEYILKESDVTNARQFHRFDSIAIGDYPMDSHATEDLKDHTRIDKGEGEAWLAKATPWYQVPFGVIVPKRIDGLLVSTAVSGTHWGYGTLRMEPVRMSMGQAAAAAAYWSILYSRNVREISPAWVQDKILSQYSYINFNTDIDRDSRHFKAINFLGARGIFANEAFAPKDALTREEALIVLNRLLLAEKYPRGMELSPLPSPTDPCTRGQFAQWLVDAKARTDSDWAAVTPDKPTYTDVPKDSPFYSAIETLKAHRISGLLFENPEIGLFRPDSPITRADAAEAIYLAHRAYAMNYWK